MRTLFWNIQKKSSFFPTIKDIVAEEDIDVLALAEFPTGANDVLTLLTELQKYDVSFQYLAPQAPQRKPKVQVFFRISHQYNVLNRLDDTSISVRTIQNTVSGDSFNMVLCHLPSKINKGNELEQYEYTQRITEEILDLEAEDGDHTVVCGDLNMNPFEAGVTAAKGLHAVMDARIAQRRSRTVYGKTYKFFYNPMWTMFGDSSRGDAPGTIYYDHSEHFQYFWNIFDQVLIRPQLIPLFDMAELKIVAQGRNYNLMTNKGRIDANTYSDHLPIKFKINL